MSDLGLQNPIKESGFGVLKSEVRFRDIETARIHSSDRVNRIHRAPGDSAQNEAERTNASIGEALVDGTALKWEYFTPFDGLTNEEIDELSSNELKEKDNLSMEKNVWRVAYDVAAMIDDESGPAGDFIKCYVTQREKNQFFFNQPYLIKYAAAKTDAKKEVPGCNYFKKIYAFKDSHCLHGAMFLEYLKGSCKDAHGKLCDFCTSREKCCSQIEHVPRPFSDHESPGYHYLPVNKTPTNNRVVDDYLPRVQLKKAYISGECSLEDPTSISNFSRQFIVSEKCVTDYLKHLKLLELRKDKRKKQRTAVNRF